MKPKLLFLEGYPNSYYKWPVWVILFLLINTTTIFSQPNTNSSTTEGNEIDKTPLALENKAAQSAKIFFEEYDIDPTKSYYGKLLNASIMRIAPSCNSKQLEMELPIGEIVTVYKYVNKEKGCWAIKYNGNYGFIRSTELMPVKDKASAEKIANEYDTPPRLITLIRPKYPKEARKRSIKGSVIVKVYINSTGKVEDVKISKGIEGLNQSALEAVEKARFKPAKNKGKPVSTWISLSIDFE